MLAYRQVSELPSFNMTPYGLPYINKMFLFGQTLDLNPTFYFYPSNPKNESRAGYYLFVQDFFNNLILLCSQKSDEEKTCLMRELSQRGKKLLGGGHFNQACAVFLAEQIVYCLFASPSQLNRDEMLMSCLFRKRALERNIGIHPIFMEVELQKARNILSIYTDQ
jgi:hypothetical protein